MYNVRLEARRPCAILSLQHNTQYKYFMNIDEAKNNVVAYSLHLSISLSLSPSFMISLSFHLSLLDFEVCPLSICAFGTIEIHKSRIAFNVQNY